MYSVPVRDDASTEWVEPTTTAHDEFQCTYERSELALFFATAAAAAAVRYDAAAGRMAGNRLPASRTRRERSEIVH